MAPALGEIAAIARGARRLELGGDVGTKQDSNALTHAPSVRRRTGIALNEAVIARMPHDVRFLGWDGIPLFATSFGVGPAVVLLHAGGPDRWSLAPLAERLAVRYAVVVPDVRGYGASVCVDPTRHTWAQYADDVFALLDHLGVEAAAVGGTGLGATVALRAGLLAPDRLRALVLISLEDIEEDDAKAAEIAWLEAFYAKARADGLGAAWEGILPMFPPVVGAMVRHAIPRANPESIIAAGAIAHDRSFRSIDELAAIAVPTLLVPGDDARHPRALAEGCARIMPNATVARVAFTAALETVEDFAALMAPELLDYLGQHHPA